MTIFEKLKEMGYDTVPESFYSNINVWHTWYLGDVKKFHTYKVHNGTKVVKCRRHTMGMANKVAADWANLLMNERVAITLEGNKEQEFFDAVCEAANFDVKANEMQEMKCALGTAAYVVTVTNAAVDINNGELDAENASIRIDYVTAPNIYPLSWDNKGVIDCAFASEKVIGNKKYLYMAIHKKVNGTYDIENHIFINQNGNLREVPLSEVKGYENIPAVIHTGMADRMFVIDRPNIVNNVDYTLPMGISVYANAIDQLKGVDVAYDSYVNEFILGKKRIMVKPGAAEDIDGNPAFDSSDVTFYVLPEDASDGDVIKEIDMSLRTTEHNTGIQDMLNALSTKCGFGERHYKFENGSVATATQIVSENSTLFRTIKKHEIVLESVLTELCRIILRVGNHFLGAGLNEDVEISIDFDDSIIEDEETDFNRDARMVQMGVLNAWEFRAKWMNEDEETAKAAMPGMDTLVSGEE